jgi:hypothetical protein
VKQQEAERKKAEGQREVEEKIKIRWNKLIL